MVAASSASAATCAQTTDPATPAAPSPGNLCWVDVTPYPFGSDGLPVDTSQRGCARYRPLSPVDNPTGYNEACYLTVTSMAFRAWNRGRAATTATGSPMPPPTPFGVWLYDGSRWTPDPTFPGKSACGGDTVLWAGKLDYWLVGGTGAGSSPICRYDGSAFGWEVLQIPGETRAKVPDPFDETVSAGSCFAWDNCWFFGPAGVRLHWNGTALADHTPNAETPWLGSRVTAATNRIGSDGRPAGVAAAWTSGRINGGPGQGQQAPPHPEGYAPAQLFSSDGAPFTPFPYEPPTVPEPGDPWRTDLVAVDLDANGRGWVAGNPVGFTPRNQVVPREPNDRKTYDVQPAPVDPFALGGRTPCTAPDSDFVFEWSPGTLPNGRAAYLWSALSVFPHSGAALAGGTLRPPAAGASRNDDGTPEPALTRVGCDGSATATRFREPDPTRGGGEIAPANYGGLVTAVAANADNDAWAATSSGDRAGTGIPIPQPSGAPNRWFQRPHLYWWNDTARPASPAGDDDEERPIEVVEDPPIFVDEAPEPEPAVLPPPAPPAPPAPRPKRVRQKAAVYGAKVAKPRKIRGDRYVMIVRFRVRRPVTIGVQALRRKTVVARSGLKRFRGKRGSLRLEINRKRWPTRVRFYTRSGSSL